jgi:hypothetical protein
VGSAFHLLLSSRSSHLASSLITVVCTHIRLGHFVTTNVKSIQRKRAAVEYAEAGQSVSFALKRVRRAAVRKGESTRLLFFPFIRLKTPVIDALHALRFVSAQAWSSWPRRRSHRKLSADLRVRSSSYITIRPSNLATKLFFTVARSVRLYASCQ